MGAGQAIRIGLGHQEQFAFVGSFSGGFRPDDKMFADPQVFNKKIRLLWIGAGTAEAARHDAMKAAHETLEKAGIKNVFVDSPFAHEWQTWRYALNDFAPRLF